MIKLLHAADLHLGARFRGLPPEKAAQRRRLQLTLPGRLAELCREEGCQLALLAGDLFDQPQATAEAVQALAAALEEMAVPVFIAPGNHDYCCTDSPYLTGAWPGNVHIFSRPEFQSVALPELDCRVWGAGYTGMDCPALLEGFRASGPETTQLMVLHGDPLSAASFTCPITRQQVSASGLQYLALGHVHRWGTLEGSGTLAAWPGCPMATGFDETGPKGVLLVEDGRPAFCPLGLGEYLDLQVEAGDNPLAAILAALPPDTRQDVARITLTGPAEPVDLQAIQAQLADRFFHLALRDKTNLPPDIWKTAGEDSLEGVYFRRLQKAAEAAATEEAAQSYILAARISRRILEGQEVNLP